MTDQSKARPFFAGYQTKQAQAGVAGDLSKTIFKSFADTPAAATAASAITVAAERAEDLDTNKRSKQFPGLAKP